jgi:DNA helicase IV
VLNQLFGKRMMDINLKMEELLKKLLQEWRHGWEKNEKDYLEILVPRLIIDFDWVELLAKEAQILKQIKEELDLEGWQNLASIIREYRFNQTLKELRSSGKQQDIERFINQYKAVAAQKKKSDRDNLFRFQKEYTEEKNRIEKEKRQKELLLERERQKDKDRQEELRRQQEVQRATEERKEQERIKLEEELKKRKDKLYQRIEDMFKSDYLAADIKLKVDPDAKLIPSNEYHELKTRFIRDWAARELKQKTMQHIDSEQAFAVSACSGDIKVTARAGSGKTKTLVTRALFLQKHCKVSPREILLLAFNKKAAEEMNNRLIKEIGINLPHVMTFHALAYALVQPEEDFVFDDASADQLGLSREIQEVIDEYLISKKHEDSIRQIMLLHFRKDWERIVDGGFNLPQDELLNYRRALPRESLKGDYVKSFGEKLIANLLFEHGVEYKYERNFRWDGINYRPDFTIQGGKKKGIIIEYFGIEGDADYDEMTERKRAFWKTQKNWIFFEFSPKEISQKGTKNFTKDLLEKLEKAGIPCKRLSEDEIWNIVRNRAIDNFTEAMKSFVGRCRKRNLKPMELTKMVNKHNPYSEAEKLFLEIGILIYGTYLEKLQEKKREDFDGLMWRSVSLVRKGKTRFIRNKGVEQGDLKALKFIMIDEFQDFSEVFFELIQAIRSINKRVQFFCVGDDWQAINGFAGSELRFFTNFNQYFWNPSCYNICTNYRSTKSVVEIGNAIMN